jgi:hypothetical protein
MTQSRFKQGDFIASCKAQGIEVTKALIEFDKLY